MLRLKWNFIFFTPHNFCGRDWLIRLEWNVTTNGDLEVASISQPNFPLFYLKIQTYSNNRISVHLRFLWCNQQDPWSCDRLQLYWCTSLPKCGRNWQGCRFLRKQKENWAAESKTINLSAAERINATSNRTGFRSPLASCCANAVNRTGQYLLFITKNEFSPSSLARWSRPRVHAKIEAISNQTKCHYWW